MSHSHSHTGDAAPLDPAQQRRALRILVMVLIPIAVWALVAMIWMWPSGTQNVNTAATMYAQPGVEMLSGEITAVEEFPCNSSPGGATDRTDTCATIDVELREGPELGQIIQTELTAPVYASGVDVGDSVRLYRLPIEGAPAAYQFADFERTAPVIVLALLFVVAVVAVARFRGAMALVGLAFGAFILVSFMFPALLAGSNPLLVGLVGGTVILYVVLFTAHGFSVRTATALVGTLFGLGLATLLGFLFSQWAHLTGVAGEDDFTLSSMAPDLRLTSVVVCSMIIASIGVLNDVTITQASAVWELAGQGISRARIFTSALRIGRDHIASSVYTITFAAAGAMLPVLLMLYIYDRPPLDAVMAEQFAAELIRTLVGAIGLIMSVPVTTALGVAVIAGRDATSDGFDDAHTFRNPNDELEDKSATSASPASNPFAADDEV
ncbi:YibE/F family protein [Parenemella sanctibonifatiensis]|uniref:YibE/F family protein n=1 Tax=Parenemella sanctibonifatiensis TaxID=2016505 RepID=A0A255E405_9ACTN|nr:YibE/F family protein [Parenemella sanctibonifatiensis]OYN84112.1 YibE/F family protein [Parenemella sanctibonifatiensis]